MLQYRLPALPSPARRGLASLQGRVNAAAGHAARVALATRLFRNKSNTTFREVKRALSEHGPIDEACYYCERDRYRDIEHIRPKIFFPGRAFRWSNYVFSCTICNQDRKRDHFAVVDGNGLITKIMKNHRTPLPSGQPAFIDIRREDPLLFLKLDLISGRFVPIGSAQNQARGRYTRDLLELDADSLARARKQNFEGYQRYFEKLEDAFGSDDIVSAQRIAKEIMLLPYPTIRAEISRQANNVPRFRQWIDALAYAAI